MLHVNSRETTFEHQRVPAARLKFFDRHATYCYTDTSRPQEFPSQRGVLFRPRSDRTSYDFVSNNF